MWNGPYSRDKHNVYVCWRWAKLRASLLPLTIILEPVSESLILGAIVSWAVNMLFCWSPLAFLFVHCLVWFLLDYVLLLVVQVSIQQYSRSVHCAISLCRSVQVCHVLSGFDDLDNSCCHSISSNFLPVVSCRWNCLTAYIAFTESQPVLVK